MKNLPNVYVSRRDAVELALCLDEWQIKAGASVSDYQRVLVQFRNEFIQVPAPDKGLQFLTVE